MSRVLLPQVHGNAAVTAAQGDVQMTPRAYQFASAWLGLLGARAALMRSDPRLFACAQLHAIYLAERVDTNVTMHRGRNGSYSNERVIASGYRLPDWWPVESNNVECCKRTWEDLDTDMVGVVSRLMAHATHHDHLFGIGFFEPSVVYGVGAASEPSGSTYFVVLAAPEETA